jgi:hypothetical protein
MIRCERCGRTVDTLSGTGVSHFCPRCDAHLEPDRVGARRGNDGVQRTSVLALAMSVDPAEVEVETGSLAPVKVTVRNIGARVEQVRLEATVDDRTVPWLLLLPGELDIFPDVEVALVMQVILSAAQRPGVWPFQVRATSIADRSVRGDICGSVTVRMITDAPAGAERSPARLPVGVRFHLSAVDSEDSRLRLALAARSRPVCAATSSTR